VNYLMNSYNWVVVPTMNPTTGRPITRNATVSAIIKVAGDKLPNNRVDNRHNKQNDEKLYDGFDYPRHKVRMMLNRYSVKPRFGLIQKASPLLGLSCV